MMEYEYHMRADSLPDQDQDIELKSSQHSDYRQIETYYILFKLASGCVFSNL